MILRARVFGYPRPQGSKRPFRWQAKDGRSGVALVESSGENLKSWRSAVRDAVKEARPPTMLSGPVRLMLTFYLQPPKNRKKMPPAPAKVPDLSKLVRAVEDELTGLWIFDDSQICLAFTQKRWASAVGGDEAPGVEISCGTWE